MGPERLLAGLQAELLAWRRMGTLYVREVPERVHGALKRRARERGSSISKEAVRLLERALEADRPEVRELLDEIRSLRPVVRRGSPSAGELVREDRDRR